MDLASKHLQICHAAPPMDMHLDRRQYRGVVGPVHPSRESAIPLPAIKVFLSHRYRSPHANLYFYGLCSKVAEVQFEVDQGETPISIARLTRMVRDADAFIGIYPFPATPSTVANRKDLETASRYFRLESA